MTKNDYAVITSPLKHPNMRTLFAAASQLTLLTLLTALTCLLAFAVFAVCAQAADPAEKTAVGKTVVCTLGTEAQKDYVIGLSKGDYCIVCDEQVTDGKPVVQAGITLLKNNGSSLDEFGGSLIHWYEFEGVWREGKVFRIVKPLGARLRVHNSNLSAGKFSITVLPVAGLKRLPFPEGMPPIVPAQIGSEKGVGGTFKINEVAYQSVTLPSGKWSISLGLKRPAGQTSYLKGHLTILDTYGFTHDPFGKRDDYKVAQTEGNGDEARGETTITLTKPTTLLLRAKNLSNNGGDLVYDITIEKAAS